MAVPPCEPGYQASRIAGTYLSAQLIDNGRPLISTNTTGFPVATTACSKSSWRPGQIEAGARFVFSAGAVTSAQHDYSHIALLRVFHCFVDLALFFGCQRITDSSDSGQLASTRSQPFVKSTSVPGFTLFRMPSNTVVTSTASGP